MPTEWVSPEEPERRKISVTIWATDRVSQRGTATFCPHYSLYFLQASVRLSNACHYLTLIYLIKKRLCVSFLIVMYIIQKLHTLKSCPYLSVTNQCLINLLGRKMKRRPPPKIWINIQQQLRCQRTPGLIVSLTTVSKQPLVLSVSPSPSLFNPSLPLLAGLSSSRESSHSSSTASSSTSITSCSLCHKWARKPVFWIHFHWMF